MKHYGDITKLSGYDLPIVDIITGGSPCQDLSVAGKRAGLAGERSGLFMEMIRIIKEMRDNDIKTNNHRGEEIRCRWMVWENVPGAFSSNKGADFQAVLEETAKVAKGDACIPGPPGGKWPHAGCIVADGWSIAWRVHDAQFWGVPQRRKRIALVADFGGTTAPEILFERKGVSGDTETCREERKGVAEDAERGIRETVAVLNDQGGSVMGISENVTGSLRAQEHGHQPIVYGISAYESNAMKSGNPNSGIYEAETARTLDLNGGSPACNQGGMAVVCLEGNGSRPSHRGDGYSESETMYTLNSTEHHAVAVENHPADSRVKISEDGKVQTLSSRMGTGGGNVPMVMEQPYNATTGSFMRAGNSGIAETLAARDYKDPQIVCNSIVRRLTPMECERLQNFPDHWTDIGEWTDSKGKKHKDADSPRYKALGNSIALPFWRWMAKRMVKWCKSDHPTMASLFDGIGGFPLSYMEAGCEPVWASEIEEFPIAVTKIRFPEKIDLEDG